MAMVLWPATALAFGSESAARTLSTKDLSMGDAHKILPFEQTNAHNGGAWTGRLPNGKSATFYSQFNEDEDLLARHPDWLSINGTYLEMGALDGFRLSNTMFFYETLGWRGVLVEPQPACEAGMRTHRGEDHIFTNATCASFQTLKFRLPDGDTCAAGSGGDGFMAGEMRSRQDPLDLTVGCSPIGHMLNLAGVRKLDLWSLDVEGAELEALRGHDWENIPVHVVLIEMLPGNNPRGEAGLHEVRSFLHERGFMNGGRSVGTAGYDEVWEHPRFAEQVARLAK